MRIYFLLVCIFLASCSANQNNLYKTKPAFYSYIISDIKSNSYKEYASDVYVTPASCQKTITALVALKYFGADYRFDTKVAIIKDNKNIVKDVIISFSGDPNLTSENLLFLLKPLKGKMVSGRIILDLSRFKTAPYSPNLMLNDIGTKYSSPVSSAIIDKNLITLQILPTTLGKTAIIYKDANYKIINNVVTSNDKTSIRLNWDANIIHATGTINIQDINFEKQLSPTIVDYYLENKIKAVLQKLNIKGKIYIAWQSSDASPEAILISQIESDSLKNTIIVALKESNNLFFDSLYLNVIYSYDNRAISTWNDGSEIIKELAKKYYDIDFDKAVFVDGSGLSRYNQVQPKKLLELLKKGFLVPEFVNALPMPREVNTTLVSRRKLPNTVRAKTGNMSGISCLCGYNIKPRSTQAFVIMANSFAAPSLEMHDAMDNFIKINLR